ncbi:50S ribosomal protein L1 [Buchnera aphidicola]|uniref:50S ribosomal protein L1 n=1 Tax=Buchnera aphidicola TaxID=9 RepID=UPI0031B80D81
MPKLTKRMLLIKNKTKLKKQYNINESILLLKEFAIKTFNESIDVSIQLGIDAKKSDQNIRGTTILPHGIGKTIKTAVFAQGDNIKLAKSAGADFIGMENLVDLIKNKKIIFDVVIASPDTMPIVSKLGSILGPKGLMPNPKLGTVTDNIYQTVKNIKTGQIRYKNDKNGIIHTTIGKINFPQQNIQENLNALLVSLKKNKPSHSKGVFIKKITLSTTMGAGLTIDQKHFV